MFRPSSALSAIDPGVSPYLGAALKLEAHRQNLAVASAAEDSIGIQRFGALTVATVLQLLGPLVVIALGFSLWSSERERGTLRLLRASGVPFGVLLRGKALALATGASLALLPAVVGAALVAGGGTGAESWARLLVLGLAYLGYFAAFGALSLLVSARATRSRDALAILVAFWGLTTLVIPRLAVEAGAAIVPLPSHDAFAAEVKTSLERGLAGQGTREERLEALTTAMMGEQGFAGADMLMDDSLLQGVELRAEAAFEDEVFAWHVDRLMDAISAQERVAQWFGLLSPTLAIRSVSMALCGTDFEHHRDFAGHAERYRRALVDRLNKDFADNAGTSGWDYRAGRALWESAPAFQYDAPALGWALGSQLIALSALGTWAALLAALAAWAAPRQRVFT